MVTKWARTLNHCISLTVKEYEGYVWLLGGLRENECSKECLDYGVVLCGGLTHLFKSNPDLVEGVHYSKAYTARINEFAYHTGSRLRHVFPRELIERVADLMACPFDELVTSPFKLENYYKTGRVNRDAKRKKSTAA